MYEVVLTFISLYPPASEVAVKHGVLSVERLQEALRLELRQVHPELTPGSRHEP